MLCQICDNAARGRVGVCVFGAWVPVGVGGREHNAVLCLGVGVCAGVVGVGVGVGVVIVIVAAKKMPRNLGRFQGKKNAPWRVATGQWERISYSASCTLIAFSAAAITVT